MIVCKKCGEKYEDDMPRCLWCDAPNPDHPLNRAKVAEQKVDDVAGSVAEQPVAEQPIAEPVAPAKPAATAPAQAPASPAPKPSENVAVIEIEQDQDAAIEQQFRQKGFL